jgi:uncharacterized protein with PIN domain
MRAKIKKIINQELNKVQHSKGLNTDMIKLNSDLAAHIIENIIDMAHGKPRKEICDKCNLYGLIPRFSESKCPKCGGPTRQINDDELKQKLGLKIYECILISFNWRKINKPE